MGDAPTFSVIIPTYNRAGLIGRTLDSVLGQTFPGYEVVVVDNCSTDNTEEVLRPYLATGKVRYIRHDRNYERARSRNTGLEAARGEYATFLDSDDLMYPSNLADAHAYARAHPDVKIFHNLYELVDPGGRVLHRYRFPRLGDPVRAIADGNFLSCIGAFLHRDVYRHCRFNTDPALTGSEDWDFWLRVVPGRRVGRIDKVNSGIVHHAGRTVGTAELAVLQGRLERIIDGVCADRDLAAVYAPLRRRMLASMLLFLASAANSGRRHGEALAYLRRAAVYDWRFLGTLRFARALQIALFHIDRGC